MTILSLLQHNLLKLIMSSLFKTKASSLAKVSALPVFRSPADLYNENTVPYDIQKQQITGDASGVKGKYFSARHHQLAKFLVNSRKEYRALQQPAARKTLAEKEYVKWQHYLKQSIKNPAVQLNECQKQRIFQAILTAKERSEQRLALSRFIKLGYEYSQAYKVDLPLNPVIIMKLVHPHFGYLNNIPNVNKYKYTYEQVFTLIEECNAASLIREKGYTLHSSELLSFIFWKILSVNNSRISTQSFIQLLKVFKFRDTTVENLNQKFSYSLKEGELLSGDENVRFDLFRQIFIDREL